MGGGGGLSQETKLIESALVEEEQAIKFTQAIEDLR